MATGIQNERALKEVAICGISLGNLWKTSSARRWSSVNSNDVIKTSLVLYAKLMFSNLVPGVLALFGQRLVAWRDSGVLEFFPPRNPAVKGRTFNRAANN